MWVTVYKFFKCRQNNNWNWSYNFIATTLELIQVSNDWTATSMELPTLKKKHSEQLMAPSFKSWNCSQICVVWQITHRQPKQRSCQSDSNLIQQCLQDFGWKNIHVMLMLMFIIPVNNAYTLSINCIKTTILIIL